MPEATMPVAASVADIKAAFPKASSDFIIACVEGGLPIAQVASKAYGALSAENETLKAKLEALEESTAAAEAKAAEQAEAEKTEATEAVEALAKARGNQPVANAGGSSSSTATATATWDAAMAKEVEIAKGNRQRAVMAVNRKNPGLREEMIAERTA